MISAVIPACNLSDLTLKCLYYLHEYNSGLLDTLVYVDNGSDFFHFNEVENYIKENFSKYKIIQFSENQGFTKAVNAGLKYILEQTESHPLILNNDCFVGPDCIYNMYTHIIKPNVGATCPLTDGPGIASIYRGSRKERFKTAEKDVESRAFDIMAEASPGEFGKTGMVPFFCSLLKRQCVIDFGLLDDIFADGLGADDEWCMRIRKEGFICGITVEAFASHLGKQSFRRLGIPRNTSKAYRKLSEYEKI